MTGDALASLRGGRVFVAGARTALGGALIRALHATRDIAPCGQDVPEEALRTADGCAAAMAHAAPTHVIVVAGQTGGIAGNSRTPADLMLDNLRVAAAVVPAAHQHGLRGLLYLASSCTYPRAAAQPMRPDALFTGALEPTSVAYATAKLAGLVLTQAYRDQYGAPFVTAIASDAYGPGDDFDPENSHVVAGLVRRLHEARLRCDDRFEVWGTGRQVRDLIFVGDLADACLLALGQHHHRDPINLSSGVGTSIGELAAVVRDVVGFTGRLDFDVSRPDGAPFKVLDAGPIRQLGFLPRTPLRGGIEETYAWFLARHSASAVPAS